MINASTHDDDIRQRVISINNHSIDQLLCNDEMNIMLSIAELQQAMTYIQQMNTSSNNDSTNKTPSNVVPQNEQLHYGSDELESSSLSLFTASKTTQNSLLRIQFCHEELTSKGLPSSSSSMMMSHVKSPIVACLCPIRILVEDDNDDPWCNNSSSCMDTDTTTSIIMTQEDIQLLSAVVLFNITVLFHTLAWRYSDRPDMSSTTIASQSWNKAIELYDIWIKLFHDHHHYSHHPPDILLLSPHMEWNHSKNNNSSNISKMMSSSPSHAIIAIQMMKTIVYNNYAQICYEMNHYIAYDACMTLLLQNHHQVKRMLYHNNNFHNNNNNNNNDNDDSTHITTTITTRSKILNSNRTTRYTTTHYYEAFIHETIQLNVWMIQILTIPNVIARAA